MSSLQAEFHEQHKRFHARIARKAAMVPLPVVRTYTIPNTPYGIPKVSKVDPMVKRVASFNVEPQWWHCMWFADLIAIREPRPPGPPTIDMIQRAVARHFNVTRHDMLSERRTADIVLPRQIAMYLCKALTLRSMPEVGRRFGGRDHTTVLHAIRKITARCVWDTEFVDEIAAIKSKVFA